ncbi:MAG: 2-oxoacid:ferredoxin oxidoreductase subunit beta [Desulfobacterales bacterium]|nr:2-oxoacid:ferredoxin oxidoreductase subunit beta [Desulfobacterales bacterium]MCP4163975.1 2-oxoacid:ferredoxin oxidoreductase subunit beta [Deltaproteobacteria bacterium]
MVKHRDSTHLVHQYLRHNKKFPHVWCPGCGNGIVLGALIRAIHQHQYERDDIVLVSGIGCSSRMPVYVDFNTIHTLHGRALTFATGIKLANPKLKVIVVTGDGDSMAIGGNHFIHAARRNIDITTIILNNNIYGMTGGQSSPTTNYGDKSTTAPYTHIEHAFKISELAVTAGASFVARGTVYHADKLQKLIEAALTKDGFSVVEAVTHCHVQYGKLNKLGSNVDMMKWQKDNSITVQKAAKMKEEDVEDKITMGVLMDKPLPNFTKEMAKLKDRAKE